MAGPAIRAVNLALQLRSSGADVVLAAPDRPDIELGVPGVAFGKPSARGFRALARAADAVVTQPQRLDVARGLHGTAARIVYDLYVPSFVEYPASLASAGLPHRTRRKLVERNHMEYAAAIECGDAFLAASQRQMDFVLGALGQAGRLRDAGGGAHGAGPPVAVVPFGLPDEAPPRSGPPVLKGPLVPEDAVVALWPGGIWNWFDPLTVVRGLAAAREQEPRLHLVFLGAGHPSSAFTGQSDAATALASPLMSEQVKRGAVVFADDWVPYERRWEYLRDADLAVCAHFDTWETRMSFRTRFLDHLWAGLPTITTAGGVLSDELCAQGAAVCVPPGDWRSWGEQLLALARDPAAREQMADRAQVLGQRYTWSRAAEPLVELLAQPASDEPSRPGPSMRATTKYLAVAVENRLR